MVFEIDPKEVERLDPSSFADFLNRLINAECDKLHIAPTKVETSSELTSTEGGVDARIEDNEQRGDHRWVPPGLSAWQFKTGETGTSPSKLGKEAVKPGVLQTLREGGSYLVAIARVCNKDMRERRKNALKKAVRRKRLDTNRVTLLTADDLKKWASEHTSILLLPYFRRPIGMCMRLEQWEQDDRHQGGFVADETRKTIAEGIRSFSAQNASPVHMRVRGRRGVGKTRVVLEALRPKGVRERVVYAQQPDDIPPELWAWLRDSTVSSAIVVVDECDDEEASKFQLQAQICEGRVRLVTIGSGEPFLSDTSPSCPFLKQLDDESMAKMLGDRFKGLSREQIAWIVRLASGYPKLAVACGSVLEQRHDVDVAYLTRTLEINEILKVFLPDDKNRRVMKALSLLTRVGFEGDVAGEAQALAGFVQVQWSEFCEIVDQMYRQGFVSKKGRYRYVTPDLLASWLAHALWDERGEEVRDLLGKLPTKESRDAFLERLKDLGSEERTRATIHELLSERYFSTIEQLDTEGGSKILYTAALADRQAALGTLERLLSTASIDRLRSFKIDRRNAVYTLDYLKWFKDTFFGATRLLLALAEAENEEWGNNATGIWTSCFQLRLGGTEVPALDRLSLIEEALSGGSPAKRKLAVKAMATLLSPHETRVSGPEKEGAQPVPSEWHPKTWGEIWEFYRASLQLVDRAMHDSDRAISREARGTLLRSLRTIVAVGLAEDAISRLESFAPEDEDERREARDAARVILQYERERLKDNVCDRFLAIEQKLAGTNFHDRVRRWVGQWSFGDWDIQKRDGGPPPQDRAAALADEGLSAPELLRAELDWLVSDGAQNVSHFGKRLGALDRDWSWLPELVSRAREGRGPVLMASYLWGRRDAGDVYVVRDLLDQWAKDEKQLAFPVLFTTLELEPSAENLKRVLALVEKGWLVPRELNLLVWRGWSEKLPLQEFEAFLGVMLSDHETETVQAAMNALDRRLRLLPAERDRLAPSAYALLEQENAVEGTMAQYHWGELSRYYVKDDPMKIAEIVLRLCRGRRIFFQEDPPMKALAEATRSRPREVWDCVAQVLLHKGEHGYRLQACLRSWYVELLPVDQLLNWASRHEPDGPRILASLTVPSGKPMSELPRGLLVRFGEDKHVREALERNLLGGSFTGSMTYWLGNKLESVRTWADDPHPRVRKWAQEVTPMLEREIQQWQEREEEEALE